MFNTVANAVEATNADASVIVPAPFVMDSIMEAIGAGIQIIVCITEGVPTLDMLKCKVACDSAGVVLIGPNCPGIITPDDAKSELCRAISIKVASVLCHALER